MSDNDLCYISAADALLRFADGSLSPVELVKAQLARIKETASSINAFSFVYEEAALNAARESERRYKDKAAIRPLEGVPLAIKDESMIKGAITTNGSLIYKTRVADFTAPVNEHLIQAGAIVIGRTTTPEFSTEGFTHSRLWGVTRNPWNPEFTPGGSSGGSGAALAGGMTTLATGSDIGGSIRIPASTCGLVGFKPPYGRNADAAPFNLDFYNHPGPIARSVSDCLLMQNVMSGPHASDNASLRPKLDLYDRPTNLKGLKIAFSMDLGYMIVDPAVYANTHKALDVFRSAGAIVTEVDIGWTLESERAARNYLGSIFGAWVAEYLENHAAEMCDYTRIFAEHAQTVTMADYLSSLETASKMYSTFGPMMEQYDIFICPTLALPAVGATHDVTDSLRIAGKEVDSRMGWIMTYPFNMLSRCPVISVPSGFSDDGVPCGIQLVGRTYADQDVFGVALSYEALVGGWYRNDSARPNSFLKS